MGSILNPAESLPGSVPKIRFELAWLQTIARRGYSIISGENLGSVSKINGNNKLNLEMARDVGFEPTRPFDHRLSRPAPYQARAIPHRQHF